MHVSPMTLVMLRQAAITRRLLRSRQGAQYIRSYATNSGPPHASRITRIESRLPRFLQRIVIPLRHAPVSHVTAFLILHEITAVIPLLALAAAFHYSNWLPPYISEGKWVTQGTEKFGRWMRKRNWITEEKGSGRWWGRGEGGVRIVVELATAYAITKALLPLRLVLSVWGTPWFARWTVLPFTNRITKMFRRSKSGPTTKSPVAGTGAVGAGVVPKKPEAGVK